MRGTSGMGCRCLLTKRGEASKSEVKATEKNPELATSPPT